MNTKRFLVQNLFALSALALITTPAFADSESFPFTIPLTQLTATSSVDDSFTLPAFDPSLGTLTGVTLFLNLTTVASPQVINLSNSTGSYTNATTSFFTTFTGPDGTAAIATTTSATDAGSVSGPAGNIATLTGTAGPVNANTPVSSSNFSDYEGTSPLNFTLAAPGTSEFHSSGSTANSLLFGGTGSVQGAASVEYDFTTTATPEPSSWLLGVVCVGMFAFLRIRVRRTV